MTIITKSHLQKNIGKLGKSNYILVNRGKPEMIIIPYFEGSEEWMEDYMEEYEMRKNSKKLQTELEKSLKSGLSKLII